MNSILKHVFTPAVCVSLQGELANQKSCWYCKERGLCTWFRISGHVISDCTKV